MSMEANSGAVFAIQADFARTALPPSGQCAARPAGPDLPELRTLPTGGEIGGRDAPDGVGSTERRTPVRL